MWNSLKSIIIKRAQGHSGSEVQRRNGEEAQQKAVSALRSHVLNPLPPSLNHTYSPPLPPPLEKLKRGEVGENLI